MKILRNILLLFAALFFVNEVNAQTCTTLPAGGPFGNLQGALPCEATCGTPITTPFDIWHNESYLLGTLIAGSEYTFTVGAGVGTCGAGFVGTVELAVYEWDGANIVGTAIGFDSDVCASGGLTVTIPADGDYIVIVSDTADCTLADNIDSGVLLVDCGPNGATCIPPPPPPVLTIDTDFCNDGAGIPYNVTDCQGMIAAEDGGNDVIYVLSVYYDAASATPYLAPAGTTVIDVFDIADNYLLVDANFYDCNGTINPLPTLLTSTSDAIGDEIIDLTAIASVCAPTVVSLFAIPLDRGSLAQTADVFEFPITLYPSLSSVVVDDGSSCGTPTVQLVAADGSVCEQLTGSFCENDGDVFTADFAATPTGAALAGAPAACGLPANVEVTCSACENLVPTLSQWGLMTLALLLMTFGALKIGAPVVQTSLSRKK